MSPNQLETITHHAMLVVCGQFGRSINLIRKMTLLRKVIFKKAQTD